jgi:uncharacterized cofD-like protein
VTNVVGIGGGHGLAVTMRAAQRYADHVTAVVSVADDGGSSGRLRASTGLPAMGDLRRCLTTLAEPDDSWARALERRFHGGELDGHPLGNLVLTALAEELGDLSAAVVAVASQLGLRATILPATDVAVTLVAEADAGPIVGQVAVHASTGIKRVALEPQDPPPGGGVVAAIEGADQILVGPGSLFTSVLAALAVPGVRDAVARSRGQRVYVCNLRAQPPETDGYDVAAHVAALREHDVEIDVVLCHPGALPLGNVGSETFGTRVVEVPVALGSSAVHDPELLGTALATLIGSG